MTQIKVLTLHQPWATLIALGIKTIETRGQAFRSLVGQRIAIHAAARQPVSIYSAGLIADHITGDRWELIDNQDETYALPLGAVVCTVRVAASLPMRSVSDRATGPAIVVDAGDELVVRDGPRLLEGGMLAGQRPYGDFRPGRFGLLLDELRTPAEPIPFRGGQGLSRSIDSELLGAAA